MTLRVSPDEIVAESTSPLVACHESWERIRLSEVFKLKTGATFKSKDFNPGGHGIPLIRIRDVGQSESNTWYSGEYEDDYLVDPGDILIGMDGDFRVAKWTGPLSLLNQRVCRLTPLDPDHYEKDFLLHLLQGYLDEVHKVTSAITVKHLSSKTISDLPVALPPLAEQQRIVATIEELFTRLDMIEPALEGLLDRLWMLRSAILADAFHANRELPDGWEETTLEDLAASAKRSITDGPFGSNLKTSHYTDSGPRVIRLQNIGEGCFIDVHAHISEDHYRRLVAHNVLAEDLVVASLFSDRFRSCLIPEHVPPAVVKADCIRIRLSQEIIPRFVNYALMRPEVNAYAVRSVHGVGRSRLGMKGVKSIPVPLPPHAEQQRIVEHLEAGCSRLDALEAMVRGLLERVGVFRQSVLAEAFAGRLVPQNPADEPASALLERIRETAR